jgi:hypothetical protein
MNKEEERLTNADWKKWGPYVTDRQWGTVREDYSAYGSAWEFTNHEMARSKTYRWGEEGIGGICDRKQFLCFALALWNHKDPLLKERYFGLTGNEGNHGEDVKELYYYLDSTPTHSYMKMLYKYPQNEFPYSWLVSENKRRTKFDPEFELIDTGIFDQDEYFDVFIEYVKASEEDILIQITVTNRAKIPAKITLLPTLWFRNIWAWDDSAPKPQIHPKTSPKNESKLSPDKSENTMIANHPDLGEMYFHAEGNQAFLCCENETNTEKLYETKSSHNYFKDGINDYIVHGNSSAINKELSGTKASAHYEIEIPALQSSIIRLRLERKGIENPFDDFEALFNLGQKEAEEFYKNLQSAIPSPDAKMIQRQAFAGMLWSKQFYYFDIGTWLSGDPNSPPPPKIREEGRNHGWKHLNNADIISMPDKWEYPWYASWDLAFHCITLAIIDSEFAKKQLSLLTHDWYMHPNGQLPAYEWSFGDVNPPVHAWSTWRVYKIDQKKTNSKGDRVFLETIFHKLLLNFTWWVNRKDEWGKNIFQGGFLGLDNIGVFDRSAPLPTGGHIEQADGTSWMAMYCLNMMRIALELSKSNPVYQNLASKFFEHFLSIAEAMSTFGEDNIGMWDNEDEFFYDVLRLPSQDGVRLKVRSMVGLIPLFAVEVLETEMMNEYPIFSARMKWFLVHRPQLANLVSRWQEPNAGEMHLLSLLRGHRIKMILKRLLDTSEFLGEYGVRAVSKFHEDHPYEFEVNKQQFSVQYTPAESTTTLFGGNSNWRGPIWMPVNFLIIESLEKFHHYYGNDFKVEYPTGSQKFFTLAEIAEELSKRLTRLFLRNEDGKRPFLGTQEKLQTDPNFKDYILFYEYFHGDNGRGVGASHQTGWTGLIAKLLHPKNT